MKYGFFFHTFQDCVYFLYLFQNFHIESSTFPPVTITAKDSSNNFFLLSRNLDFLRKECDKVFILFSDWSSITNGLFRDYKNIKKIMSRPGENIPPHIQDGQIKTFLDEGNLCISSSTLAFEHENFISDYALNMYYFYNLYGYGFLNYYENPDKKQLVGVYHTDKHISNASIENRIQIFNNVKKILGDDVQAFPSFKSLSIPSNIFLEYNYFGLWEKNFITSYTDYNTTVCNIIYETVTVLDGQYTLRDHITEKTLKCLLFSGECNIFFIWVGSPTQYKFMKDNNFWALNFEFMKENPSRTDIFDSVEATVNFLKQLKKQQFSNNNQIYSYLLNRYKKHLKKNKVNLQKILNNCSLDTQNKILNFIKKD